MVEGCEISLNNVLGAFRGLQKVMQSISAAALGLTICIIFAQTFMRYVIFHSIPWSEELSRYLFVLIVMLAGNIEITDGKLVSIDIVDGYLGPKTKKAFDIGRTVVGTLVNAFFFYSSFGMVAIGRLQRSPALQLKMSNLYLLLSLGFFLTTAACIVRLCILIMKKEGEEL